MAYSSGAQVIDLSVYLFAEKIVKASLGIDLDATAVIHHAMGVPIPLMIYAFGLYVTEALAATMAGSIFLEHADLVAGTAVTIHEFDVDVTTAKKGDGINPMVTAATGSESILVDNVIYAPHSAFPVVVPAPRVLQVRHIDSGTVVGEGAPFIIARWLPFDLRSTEAWGNTI